MINTREFLNYKTLNEKQKDMIVEMINTILPYTDRTRRVDNSLHPVEDWHPISTLEPVRSIEEVEAWEAKHALRLPEDFRWFITTVGTDFYPNYHMSDIRDNDDYTTIIDPTIDPDEGCLDVSCNYFFCLGCSGCSYEYALTLRENGFGGVFEIDWDYIDDYCCFQTPDELNQYIRNNLSGGPSFLDWYKQSLVNFYKEKVIS